MNYSTPELFMVGSAQALVLGKGNGPVLHPDNISQSSCVVSASRSNGQFC